MGRPFYPSLSMRSVAGQIRRLPIVAPSGPPVVTGEYYDYSDDFASPAGVNAMTGRANWSGGLSSWVTDNGAIHQNALYGAAVSANLGGSTWPNFDVTFNYLTGGSDASGAAWDGGRQKFNLWTYDGTNYGVTTIDAANKRLTTSFTVNGSTTNKNWADLRGTAGGTGNITFLPSGTLRVQVDSLGHMRVWIDGQALWAGSYTAPLDYLDLSAYVVNRDGSIGVQQNTYRWPVIGSIGLRGATVVCTAIDGAVGRDAYTGAGATTGTPTVSGTYSGAPVNWVARALLASDYSTVVTLPNANAEGWVNVTATTGSGAYSFPIALPIGGPYVIEHGFQTAVGGPVQSTFSPPTLVAYRFISYGQSVSLGRGSGGTYSVTALANVAVPAAVYNDNGNYSSGYMVNGDDPFTSPTQMRAWSFVNPASQISGKPIMFEAYGVSGATISGLANGSGAWTAFTAALATRKGVIEAMIWDQGQGDADTNAFSFDTDIYPNYASSFLTGIVAPIRALTGNPTLPIYTGLMGRYASNTPPASLTQSVFDSQRSRLLLLKYSLTTEGGGSDANIHAAAHQTAMIYEDAYHPSSAVAGGYPILNQRDAWNLMSVIGTVAHNGNGPKPVSATRSGAVINVQLDMNGAASLSIITLDTDSGSAVTPTQPTNRFNGWDFSLSSTFGTLLAVSGWAIGADGHSIDFTLSAAPGAVVYARNCYGAGFNDKVMVHGVYSGAGYDGTIPVARTLAGTGYLTSN